MLRKLLILPFLLVLTACATPKDPIVEYRYIEKPALNVEVPSKPKMINSTEFVIDNGLVCTTPDGIKNHMIDMIEVQNYIEKMEEVIKSYQQYYENK